MPIAAHIKRFVVLFIKTVTSPSASRQILQPFPLHRVQHILVQEGVHDGMRKWLGRCVTLVQRVGEDEEAVPIELKVSLKIGAATTTVTVQAEANDLLETTPTAHTDVGEALIKALPVQNQSTGFAELVTNAAPGVAADGDGFYHPLGEHADTSIVLDNQPIPDQQSKIFSNQLAAG